MADIVANLSDTYEVPKPRWKERKVQHLGHLKGASRSALLLFAADKLHNAQSILWDLKEVGEAVWKRFNGGRDGTLWYYQEAADLLVRRLGADHLLVGRLKEVVASMRQPLASSPEE